MEQTQKSDIIDFEEIARKVNSQLILSGFEKTVLQFVQPGGRHLDIGYGKDWRFAGYLAWKYPEWKFHIFGIEPTLPVYCDNVEYYGLIPEPEMDKITKNFGLCLRYNFHDGFPQVICKALMRRQFTLTRLDYDVLTLNFRDMKELVEKFDEIDFKIENGETNKKMIPKGMINNFDFIK